MQFAAFATGHLVGLVLQLVLRIQAGLDASGEVDLLLGVQQGDLTDLLEVVLHRVCGCSRDRDLLDRLVGFVRVGDDETALDVDSRVGALAQSRSLGSLGILLLGLFLDVALILIVGVGLQVRILQILPRGFEVLVVTGLDVVDDFLLRAASRRLLGGLVPARVRGAGRLRAPPLSGLVRARVGVGDRLGGLPRTRLLRAPLLRGGLAVGRLLLPTLRHGRGRLLGRGGRLLTAGVLLRGGCHLRDLLVCRGVLYRSARCTHTGPFH